MAGSISKYENWAYDIVFVGGIVALMAYTGFRLYTVYSQGTNLALG